MRFTALIIPIATVLTLSACRATEPSQSAFSGSDSTKYSKVIATATQPSEGAETPTEWVVAPTSELPVATEPTIPNVPKEEPTITEPSTPDVSEKPSVITPTVPEEPTITPPVHIHSYTVTTTPPTCTEQGVTRYTCPCGKKYEEYPLSVGP